MAVGWEGIQRQDPVHGFDGLEVSLVAADGLHEHEVVAFRDPYRKPGEVWQGSFQARLEVVWRVSNATLRERHWKPGGLTGARYSQGQVLGNDRPGVDILGVPGNAMPHDGRGASDEDHFRRLFKAPRNFFEEALDLRPPVTPHAGRVCFAKVSAKVSRPIFIR